MRRAGVAAAGSPPWQRASRACPQVLLELPPAKQKLLWMGRAMADEELLWALGVRTDDELTLEFE